MNKDWGGVLRVGGGEQRLGSGTQSGGEQRLGRGTSNRDWGVDSYWGLSLPLLGVVLTLTGGCPYPYWGLS